MDVECSSERARNYYEVFSSCKPLRSINLPSARIAEALVFENCEELTTEVKFGSKLKSIEEEAFIYYENLWKELPSH